VKILKKTCAGSGGCKVTFRIEPKFVGTGSTTSLSITYEVLGGTGGPHVNTFITDEEGNNSVDQAETISTASSTVRLTARVTGVRRG
jgi:hypothetical protein